MSLLYHNLDSQSTKTMLDKQGELRAMMRPCPEFLIKHIYKAYESHS